MINIFGHVWTWCITVKLVFFHFTFLFQGIVRNFIWVFIIRWIILKEKKIAELFNLRLKQCILFFILIMSYDKFLIIFLNYYLFVRVFLSCWTWGVSCLYSSLIFSYAENEYDYKDIHIFYVGLVTKIIFILHRCISILITSTFEQFFSLFIWQLTMFKFFWKIWVDTLQWNKCTHIIQ